MSNPHQQFYDAYVHSGQAGAMPTSQTNLSARFAPNKPYFMQRILPFVPKNRQARIVDLACGHGKHLYFLAQQGYTNIAGVDISAEQVLLAHELGIDCVTQGTLQEFVMQQSQPPEAVLLLDILEHLTLEETVELLRTLHKRMAPGNHLIIHVPNAEGLFGMRIRYGDLTHTTAFTPTSIRQLAKSIGYQHIRCIEDNPVIYSVTSLARRLIWSLGTLPFRLLLMAETGAKQAVLSQNMLVVLKC